MRTRAYAALAEALAAPDYAAFRLRLGEWLEGAQWRHATGGARRRAERAASAFGKRLLDARYRKARKLGRKITSRTPTELHRLRLALKKLRYAGEFFAPLFPRRDARQFRRAAAAMQDQLGHLNDLATVEERLAELVNEAGKNRSRAAALARATAMVIGWQARGVQDSTASIADSWQRFHDIPPFWRKNARR